MSFFLFKSKDFVVFDNSSTTILGLHPPSSQIFQTSRFCSFLNDPGIFISGNRLSYSSAQLWVEEGYEEGYEEEVICSLLLTSANTQFNVSNTTCNSRVADI